MRFLSHLAEYRSHSVPRHVARDNQHNDSYRHLNRGRYVIVKQGRIFTKESVAYPDGQEENEKYQLTGVTHGMFAGKVVAVLSWIFNVV